MYILKLKRPALILVDIQKGFEDIKYWGGHRNNPNAEFRASELLKIWRDIGLPVFHVQHCSSIMTSPLHETHPGNQFNDLVTPIEGEPIIKKNVNSAFIGTDLQVQLDNANITSLIIAGLTTDHCISTTTRMAGNLGYDTFLAADATAVAQRSKAKSVKRRLPASISSMQRAGLPRRHADPQQTSVKLQTSSSESTRLRRRRTW